MLLIRNGSYIEPPFGRCPLPTPLITEDQFVEHLIEKQKKREAKNRQLLEVRIDYDGKHRIFYFFVFDQYVGI